MVWDVTNPRDVHFVQYLNNQRDQRDDHAPPHRRPTLTRRAGVAYAPVQMTTPVRTWWAWRRERSGSVAC
jgi:hypothetical protein